MPYQSMVRAQSFQSKGGTTDGVFQVPLQGFKSATRESFISKARNQSFRSGVSTMETLKAIQPKGVSESLWYDWTFTPRLAAGDSIVPGSGDVKVYDDTAAPEDQDVTDVMLTGSANTVGNTVFGLIVGGTAGKTYRVRFSATTVLNSEVVNADLLIDVVT